MLDDYYWHYDYPRLAWDTGFCFDKYKYPNLDKNKICLIDIDRIVKERDVASVERNVPTVLQYVLDNDQAEVLDSNFVKLFRLSQLSVEYLLFCKKYLDKTVVLLKKDILKLKEELKELKQYSEELETHISSSKNLTARYTCERCSKMFSSEDFLTAHIKRRHNENENKDSIINAKSEADKLHSEIKELKERLNNTEKFIHNKPENKEVDNFKEIIEENEGKSEKLVTAIQESLEKFREQVEDKMTSLQCEKSFFTDKYDKLFEIVLQYKNKEYDTTHVHVVEEKKAQEILRIENTGTQTEEIKQTPTDEVQLVQHDSSNKDGYVESNKNVEDIDEKIEKKLSHFEENIETKISAGLCSIETQIQTFWQKLSEGDLTYTPQTHEVVKIVDQPVQIEFPDLHQCKPKIKPRTKFSETTTHNSTNCEKEILVERLKDEIDKVNKPKPTVDAKIIPESVSVIKSPNCNIYETSSDNGDEFKAEDNAEEDTDIEIDTLEDMSPRIMQEPQLKSNQLPIKTELYSIDKNLPPKRCARNSAGKDKDVTEKLYQQLNNIVDASLQEMGISPSWKGIPKKTFDRAMEIVKHQATINKKYLPEYDYLKKSIEKLLRNDKCMKETPKITKLIDVTSVRKRTKPKTIKIQIKKNETLMPKSSSVVEIKNRSLYESDESETEFKRYLPRDFQDREGVQDKKTDHKIAHSAVIEELQAKFLQKNDTDSDLDSNILSVEENDKEKETKSAMRTNDTEASSVKKKVFFNVQEIKIDDSIVDKKQMKDDISDFTIT